MATTPEGKVKARIKEVLDKAPTTTYFMPVQTGYGAATLDFLGCSAGRFFAVEAKAAGKIPTYRQEYTIRQYAAAGGAVFVLAGEDETTAEWVRFKAWLKDA